MAKSVPLFTMVNGEPMNVGNCHPGQARILQKNGTAEWNDGKLWLKAPEPEIVPGQATEKVDWEEEYGYEIIGRISEVPDSVKSAHQAQEIFREIDPEGLMRGAGRRAIVSSKLYPTAKAFLMQLKLQMDEGRELWTCDDPKQGIIGYVINDTDSWIGIRLTAWKATFEDNITELAEVFELTPDEMRQAMYNENWRGRFVNSKQWKEVVEEALEDVPGPVWDRGHTRETLNAYDFHKPASKRLTTANARMDERKAIRTALQAPHGWAVYQWPRDKSRIQIFNKEGHPVGPADEPWSAGAYRRGARKLVRVRVEDEMVLWEAATMEDVWEVQHEDPETGLVTTIKLPSAGTGRYVAAFPEPRVARSLEEAYASADAWLLG